MIRDLGDGLVLRHATPADADLLVAFNSDVHREPGATEPDRRIGAWTRDLLERPHPTYRPGDFTIVEELATGRIVSSLNLISQRWSYGGTPFGVGQPELVGTHPDFRRRGLVRHQMEVIHGWSRERGEFAQVISGIPWYYRQFGYEYAVEMSQGRSIFMPQIPKLEARAESFEVRLATERDLPTIEGLDELARKRYLVGGAIRNQALWRHELNGHSDESAVRRRIFAVRASGQADADVPVGFAVSGSRLWGGSLAVGRLELASGISWIAAMPSLLRGLAAVGRSDAERSGSDPCAGVTLMLDSQHPAYGALSDRRPRLNPGYAWYVRVPDLPAFLRHVAPVLDANLAASSASGHTGQLWLSFFRSGLRLTLDDGRLVGVETTEAPPRVSTDAGFPALTFLQLLFGHRSLDELNHVFPDCYTRNPAARQLLEALFPKQPSHVWALG